ncbi:cephalosporin hydroxylase family protein, partial [Planktomarina temperata]|nr:cephalosporin hydroxylase family protein [Planktomarina temperata]
MTLVNAFKYSSGSFFPEQAEHVLNNDELQIVENFHNLYFRLLEKRSGLQISWLGHQTGKVPSDLWLYQEILTQHKPDLIIETGTHWGGSALFLATICSLINHGEVLSIDLYHKDPLPNHERITYLQGSSVSEEVQKKVTEIVGKNKKVLVILDSDHTKNHVEQELSFYSKFIQKGDLLIVEDTFLGGHPSHEEYGEGPTEAIISFLQNNNDFYIDKSFEKFLFTLNYGGFLKRKT